METDKLVFVLAVLAENLHSGVNIERVQQAIDIVVDEIAKDLTNKVVSGIKTTDQFNKDCEVVIENDYWCFYYKKELIKKSKSKFDCLLAKKELQNELKV